MSKRSTPAYIYELKDPNTKKTYYVGKSNNPAVRFRQHVAESRKHRSTPKTEWISGLLRKQQLPELVVAQRVTSKDWAKAEAALIREHVNAGSPLTNVIKNPRQPRPTVNMRSQDFWDDLTAQFVDLKRRMYVCRVRDGLILQQLWNYKDQGWRFEGEIYESSDFFPDENGHISFYPFTSRRKMAAARDWVRDGLVTYVHLKAFPERWETSPRIEDLAPEDLGLSSTAWRKERYRRPSKGFNRRRA